MNTHLRTNSVTYDLTSGINGFAAKAVKHNKIIFKFILVSTGVLGSFVGKVSKQ